MSAISKSRIVKEGCLDVRIVEIVSPCRQILTQVLYTILESFSDKAKEHKRQHHVALFEERTRVAPEDLQKAESMLIG